jgi:hypothetical protein
MAQDYNMQPVLGEQTLWNQVHDTQIVESYSIIGKARPTLYKKNLVVGI